MKLSFIWLYVIFCLVLVGCTSSEPAPVRDAGHRVISGSKAKRSTYLGNTNRSNPVSTNPTTRQKLTPGTPYQVQRGDTLYGVAWMYDADVKALIEQNALKPPYTLFTGQTIHYSVPADRQTPNVGSYTVKPGDQLLVIATKNNMTFSQLIEINHLKKPYMIHPGQKLLINQDNRELVATNATSDPTVGVNKGLSSDRAVDQKNTNMASKSIVVDSQSVYSDKTKLENNKFLTWRWPTKGQVTGWFKAGDMGNKGIDITGQRGQPVYAAASGRVVYAGNALRGYGNLIIIKHNDDYLSAYAHNDAIKVTEQQMVKAGQMIADMGNSESDSVQLHFEIRYKGQSVDPMKYLPKR